MSHHVWRWLGRPMTLADAEIVRRLHKDTDMTWRELASAFFLETVGVDKWDGNQIAGMDLWLAATELLGETWE